MLAMKNPVWLGLVVLLAFSCRKSPSIEDTSSGPTAAGRHESTSIRVGALSAKAETAGEAQPKNPRTRPLPRPDDPKRKPAPPRDTPAPTAVAVKDKPGFVMSPFNDKFIDVRDIPPGTLVADPTYPVSEKKYFRVS